MAKVKNFWQNGQDILFRRQSGVLSAALIIASTYGVSMILGLFRDRLIVARFYACCAQQLDVYVAASRIPDTIFQLIVIGALSAAFIPVFSETLAKGEEEGNRLASSLINLLLAFFLPLSLIVFFLAKPFSRLITWNYSPDQISLMAQMTRVMLFAQIFFLISSFLSALAQTFQRFLLPSLSAVVYNVGIIISVLVFGAPLGIMSVPFGVLLGALFQFLIQVPLVSRLGFRYSLILDWTHSGVKKIIRLMLPRTMSLAVTQLELTVATFLATSLSPGSLILYNLAQRLVDLPVRLLGTSVGQATLPLLSLQAAEKKTEEFKKTLNQSLSQIFYIALPATAIFLVLRVQLVRFAYGAKSFPWGATITTGRTLAVIAFSIFSQCAVQLLIRGYYALHDTRTPFIISLISVGINIGLSLLLIFTYKLGIFGLALAFTASNLFDFFAMLVHFNLKKENFLVKGDFANWSKMLAATAVSAFFTWGSMRILDLFVFETTRVLPLLLLTLLSGGTGLATYLLTSQLLKVKEISLLASIGNKLRQWRSSLFAVEEVIETHSDSSTGI